MKLAVHAMVLPLASAVGVVGEQLTVASLGKNAIAHVAASAALGPLLVHANVPFTVLPAAALAGNATLAAMSALGVTVVVKLAVSLVVSGSAVALPAVTVPITTPVSGAV